MRRYRAAIFKYAILFNVPLAAYLIWQCGQSILDYAISLEQWRAAVAGHELYGFDGPVQPHPRQLLFAWTLLVAASGLMLTSLASLRRCRSWDYWLRIFSFLAVLCATWSYTFQILGLFLDEGAADRIFLSWNAIRPMFFSLLATLWLAYNISYRPAAPDAGAPSR